MQFPIDRLNKIGIALSTERDKTRLMKTILAGAQELTNADGCTLYLLENDKLHFEIMHNQSLSLDLIDDGNSCIPLPAIPLYSETGEANLKTVAAHAALTGKSTNIENIYKNTDFDFSGTRAYDGRIGYISRSFLTVPMRNHENDVIGVLQLINSINPDDEQIQAFSNDHQQLVESLASQAAIAMSNHGLIQDLQNLLEKFIEIIAATIDEKSPYTGDHCRRVPEIAMAMADAINKNDNGPLADFKLDEKQLYELKIAALLHDCGKIATPVHVVDKATKLETIFDRIQLLDSRFEIICRDLEIAQLKQQLEAAGVKHETHAPEALTKQLNEDFEFLKRANQGAEFMSETDRKRVRKIGGRMWQTRHGEARPLISAEEIDNLTITKGTLLEKERQIINNHIVTTLNMLEALPFPKHLCNVAEIAGNHHERMDGKGYPRGLKREEMSVQARLMGIADIFEALTAADRPYKEPMKLSQVLNILARMARTGHIDPDLFEIFIRQQVYLTYAEKNLHTEQIDHIDPNTYLE